MSNIDETQDSSNNINVGGNKLDHQDVAKIHINRSSNKLRTSGDNNKLQKMKPSDEKEEKEDKGGSKEFKFSLTLEDLGCGPSSDAKSSPTKLSPKWTLSLKSDQDDSNTTKDRLNDGLVWFSRHFQITLKGGKLNKVLAEITATHQTDDNLIDVLLLTYRKFLTPEELLERLLSQVKHDDSDESKVILIRLGNFLKRWVSNFSFDFRGNQKLVEKLVTACRSTFVNNEKALGESIIRSLEEQLKNQVRESRMVTPSNKKLTILSLDMKQFAEQITLYEHEIYSLIQPFECLDSAWNSVNKDIKAPRITALIEFTNSWSLYIVTTIVKEKDLKVRVNIILKLLELLVNLRRLNNFNGCYEVISGLDNSAVYRLYLTWQRVKKNKQLWNEYVAITEEMKPASSWKSYRHAVKNSNPPCLPYLGVYLTDLTFIEDGNRNYLNVEGDHKDVINLEKMRKQAVLIKDILLYQVPGYPYKRDDQVFHYLTTLDHISKEDELHQLSLLAESREQVTEAKDKYRKRKESKSKKLF